MRTMFLARALQRKRVVLAIAAAAAVTVAVKAQRLTLIDHPFLSLSFSFLMDIRIFILFKNKKGTGLTRTP